MRGGRAALAAALSVGLACSAAAAGPHAWLDDWASQQREDLHGAATAGAAPMEAQAREARPSAPGLRLRASTEAERNAQKRTVTLYDRLIGATTARGWLWTGAETANPLTRDEGFRWNSLRDQGLLDPSVRKRVIDELTSLGVVNIRLGFSNHEIDLDRPESWADHDALIADFAAAGFNISLDLNHFGVEDAFRTVGADGRTAPELSYYLHPAWPDHLARFAREAARRYGDQVKAWTLVNEPETTVGFSSEMWHAAYPGWGHPDHDAWYVTRAFRIATAAVKARLAIEEERAARGQEALFVHTEAAVFKPGVEDFNRVVRFLPSDLILGRTWLFDADLDRLANASLARLARLARLGSPDMPASVGWMVRRYVLAADDEVERERRRARLVGKFKDLRRLHREFRAETGKTMAAETVFAVDYYAHNEPVAPDGGGLSPEPQFYLAQLRAGERRGLQSLILDYYDRYRLPVMVGETGTPYHAFAEAWHKQMMIECAAARAKGAPMLGYTLYPVLDTYGWEMALSRPRAAALHNPSGLLDLALAPRPFVWGLLDSLNNRVAAHAEPEEASELR